MHDGAPAYLVELPDLMKIFPANELDEMSPIPDLLDLLTYIHLISFYGATLNSVFM